MVLTFICCPKIGKNKIWGRATYSQNGWIKLDHTERLIFWYEFVLICKHLWQQISGGLFYRYDWKGVDDVLSGRKFLGDGETSTPPKVDVLLLKSQPKNSSPFNMCIGQSQQRLLGALRAISFGLPSFAEGTIWRSIRSRQQSSPDGWGMWALVHHSPQHSLLPHIVREIKRIVLFRLQRQSRAVLWPCL